MIYKGNITMKNEYCFECNLSDDYKNLCNYDIDEWGCAILWFKDLGGVEYNFCINNGTNLSAIYKLYYKDKETDDLTTDYDTFEHYEIDFNNANWKDELLKAMLESAKKFFE